MKLIKSFHVITLILSALLYVSCSDETASNNDGKKITKQTIIMYYPWAGLSMFSCFNNNIDDFETGIEQNGGLDGKRLVVFIARNAVDASLVEITFTGGKCRRDTLKKYKTDSNRYVSADGITSTLKDIKSLKPSETYSLIIGGHGSGWLPVKNTCDDTGKKYFFKRRETSLTRFFGHGTDDNYQTDITTLADGIKAVGIKMKSILFDVCYMSNVETAYDLKNVTDYLIASPTEIMNYGMPYAVIGKSIIIDDYKGICDGFKSFYSNYHVPCGTISITDCRELDAIAYLMKNINTACSENAATINGVQVMDGFSPCIFFDFGDYVKHLCNKNTYLYECFSAQLAKLVPYKDHTPTFYSDHTAFPVQINTYSGITVSDPSNNFMVKEIKKNTSWYKATH